MSDTQKRGNLRSQATQELKKLRSNLQNTTSQLDVRALNKSIRILEDYQKRINVLDTAILKTLTESKAIEDEIQKSGEYYKEILESKVDAEVLLKEIEQSALLSSSSSGNLSNSQRPDASKPRMFKLPKFEMETYSGDPIAWQSFWDKFKVAIHDNETLSDIEKFTYLLGYLTDEAHKVASGYQLTIKNYEQVIADLKERFGDPQRAMFAHFEAMLAIPAANHDVVQLQAVSDECEMHIRSLDALGLPEDTFGIVFAPIILSKLPKYVRTELFRKNGKQKWTLENIRDWLKQEIHARELGEGSFAGDSTERRAGSTQKSSKKGDRRPWSSSSSRVTSQNHPNSEESDSDVDNCLFCDEDDHRTEQCPYFPDVDSRKVALPSDACYNCLRSGKHHRSECPDMGQKCVHCRKAGHHPSLCLRKFGSGESSGSKSTNPGANVLTPGTTDDEPGDSSNVAVANHRASTDGDVPFLPTAVAEVQDTDAMLTAKARLLMDSASSRSYITSCMSKKLRLKNIGYAFVSVGHFGSNKRSTSRVERVMFNVLCRDGGEQPVLAYVTPTISCPISRVKIDPKCCPSIDQLQLAEPNRDGEFALDILIGSDQYYNFVEPANLIKCKDDGLVFVSSRLGLLTAGTMRVEENCRAPTNTLTLLSVESWAANNQESGDNVGCVKKGHLETVGREFTDHRVVDATVAKNNAVVLHQTEGLRQTMVESSLKKLMVFSALLGAVLFAFTIFVTFAFSLGVLFGQSLVDSCPDAFIGSPHMLSLWPSSAFAVSKFVEIDSQLKQSSNFALASSSYSGFALKSVLSAHVSVFEPCVNVIRVSGLKWLFCVALRYHVIQCLGDHEIDEIISAELQLVMNASSSGGFHSVTGFLRVLSDLPEGRKDSVVQRKDGDVSAVWRQPTPRSSRRPNECDKGEAGRKDTSYPSRDSKTKPKTASSRHASVNGSDTRRSESYNRTKKARCVADLHVSGDGLVAPRDVEQQSRGDEQQRSQSGRDDGDDRDLTVVAAEDLRASWIRWEVFLTFWFSD